MKIIQKNKNAFRDYEIIEKIEAGIELSGTEVKSLREGRINFKEGFCRFKKHELFLTGVNISPYSYAKYFNHEPERDRKLLLHKRELRRLKSKVMEKGLSIIPICIYFNEKNFIKVEIGLGRGKKLFDKRDDLKKKTINREIEKSFRQR